MIKKIKYEGKIEIEGAATAKTLLRLMQFFTEEEGFSVDKYKSDEVKLLKLVPLSQEDLSEQANPVQVKVEVEMEVSDDEMEIEIESTDLDLVKGLITEVSALLGE